MFFWGNEDQIWGNEDQAFSKLGSLQFFAICRFARRFGVDIAIEYLNMIISLGFETTTWGFRQIVERSPSQNSPIL